MHLRYGMIEASRRNKVRETHGRQKAIHRATPVYRLPFEFASAPRCRSLNKFAKVFLDKFELLVAPAKAGAQCRALEAAGSHPGRAAFAGTTEKPEVSKDFLIHA